MIPLRIEKKAKELYEVYYSKTAFSSTIITEPSWEDFKRDLTKAAQVKAWIAVAEAATYTKSETSFA